MGRPIDIEEFLTARNQLLDARNYQEAKSKFRWPQQKDFNWASDYFDTLADRCSNPALIYVDDKGPEIKVSFQRLKERSNKIANFFCDLGLKKGDRIFLILHNCLELFEILLGAMKVGCAIIPASTLLTTDDIKDRISRGKVRCIIADGEFTERIDQSLPSSATSISKVNIGKETLGWIPYDEVDLKPSSFESKACFLPQDELLVYFTSGTTARPKLVLHTYASYPLGHLTTMYWIGLKKGDLHYNISAPGWAKHAWSSVFAPWNAEATVFVYNYSGRFDPKKVLEVIQKHKVSTLCAPPTVWRFLLLEDLSKFSFSLRQLVSAGEPLNPEIIKRVKSATGLTIREGYGQTETTLQIAVFPGMEMDPGCMGVEAPGFNIDILDEQLCPAPANTEGAIAIRTKPERPVGLMTGYIDPPEKNLEVFVNDWYLTGDVAYKDGEGHFFFIGRSDDVFKSSDYRISAFELESELIIHPSVTEVAVVASPDLLKGFIPKAFLILKPHVHPSRELAIEIFKLIREKIAPYKRPRIIQFVEELPKTVSGKIRRVDLRREELEQRYKGTRSANEFFESDFKEELRGSEKGVY